MALNGFQFIADCLERGTQQALVGQVMDRAVFYRPVTPGGKAMSVEMTNLGPLGWVTDARGYRYEPRHPVIGEPWGPIPGVLLDLWSRLADPDTPPDACLVNLYRAGARMGAHRDADEADFSFPVLSISLGDTAIFRLGGLGRRDPTSTLRLASGDVCLLGGEARLAYHGIDRILSGSSQLIPGGGRLNLTLRRAGPRS